MSSTLKSATLGRNSPEVFGLSYFFLSASAVLDLVTHKYHWKALKKSMKSRGHRDQVN
jgi:hypothetical protein